MAINAASTAISTILCVHNGRCFLLRIFDGLVFLCQKPGPCRPQPKKKSHSKHSPCLPAASVRYDSIFCRSFSRLTAARPSASLLPSVAKSCKNAQNHVSILPTNGANCKRVFGPLFPVVRPFGHSSWKELCFPLRFLPVLGDFSRDCSLTSFLSYFIIYLTDRRPRPADNFMPAQVPPAHGGIQCEVGCNSRAIPLLCRWSAPLGGHWFSKLGRLGRAVKPSQKTAFAGRMFHFLRGNRE